MVSPLWASIIRVGAIGGGICVESITSASGEGEVWTATDAKCEECLSSGLYDTSNTIREETLAVTGDLHDSSVRGFLVPRRSCFLRLYSRSKPPPKEALPAGLGEALQLCCVFEGSV